MERRCARVSSARATWASTTCSCTRSCRTSSWSAWWTRISRVPPPWRRSTTRGSSPTTGPSSAAWTWPASPSPPASTSPSRALCAVAERTGAVLHVGHVERFNGAVDELRQIVRAPILIESRRLGPFASRVQRDTVVMDLMIHDIDIVLGLVDSPPVRLAAQGTAVHSSVTDVASVQIRFESGTIATITASRATEEKVRTLAITMPDAYVHLDYTDQDIRIYRRANQQYTMSRKAIRYSRASLVEHLQVHRENPLKLEIQHLIAAHRRRQAGQKVELNLAEDLTSLAMALEIERMIRDGVPEIAWPKDLPWSGRSD